jgi:hypothetical protein
MPTSVALELRPCSSNFNMLSENYRRFSGELRVKPFTDEEVKINPYNGDLFLELGHNVALITEKVLHHLIETKHVFLYKSGYLGYEAKEQAIALEVESEVLARIRGAWEVAKRMPGSTTT